MRPSTGEDFALVMPRVSTEAMSVFPADAATLPADQHAVLVLDRAGWHGARALEVPETITLVPLPPYSPEPGPVEQVWLYLRERHLSHRLLADYDAVVDARLATPGTRSPPRPVAPGPSLPTRTSNRSRLKRAGVTRSFRS